MAQNDRMMKAMTRHDQIAAERGRGAGSRGAQVYEVLIERIRSGDLRPGTRLREEDLAKTLDVSRTPVREALGRLQARGLVETSLAGLCVTELTRQQTMELYAMRAALEGSAARFAAENASPADLAALEHAAQLFANCQGAPVDFAAANRTFHDVILEAAHNRYLSRMLADLNDWLALLPDTTFSVEGRATGAIAEHAAIADAILAHDGDAAERAARAHIDRARDARLQMMFQAG